MKLFFEKYLHNSMALCVLLSITLNMIIESVSRQSFLNGLGFLIHSPMTFIYNTIIIFATLAVAFLVKRRIFVYIVVTIFWLAIGITNGVILSFRTTPFTVTDLALLESVASIIPSYLSTTQIVLVAVAAIVVLASLVLAFIFMPKHKKKVDFRKSIAGLLILAISMFGITNLAINQKWVSTYFDNLNYAYNDYGVPYCFINTWLNTGISAPRGYSSDEILNIFTPEEQAELKEASKGSKAAGDTPNIIMLQLESFFDPNQLKGVTYSENPVPNFEKLQSQYTSGYMTVPVLGAGTANTEFEVISGMRVRFFGPGEYPYKSVLKDKTCETINYDLKDLGYSTHAIHNHRGAFYGRNKVFSNLGFDTFTSLEYMNNVVKTPKNWAKDGVLTGEITAALESTKGKDFVYTISVQGHGQYPTNEVLKDPAVTFTGLTEGIDSYAFEYYLQQAHEMDAFIGELVKTLDSYDEDTVLVLYGDHLPSLNLNNDELVSGSVYKQQYIMWDNFGMKEKDKDLYSYQLSAEVLDRVGVHDGVITKYHQNHSKDANYLKNLKALQYDMLYGKDYIFDKSNPFKATDLKMGVKKIKIDQIVEVGGKYYIKGENFTPFSKISINEDVLDTIFLGPTILGLLDEVDANQVDDMKVSQVEKNQEILSTTE